MLLPSPRCRSSSRTLNFCFAFVLVTVFNGTQSRWCREGEILQSSALLASALPFCNTAPGDFVHLFAVASGAHLFSKGEQRDLKGGGEGAGKPLAAPRPAAGFAAPFAGFVWHCRTRHAPFTAPRSALFSGCPLGPALFVGKNELSGGGMFPRQGARRSVWTSGHFVGHVKAGGSFEGLTGGLFGCVRRSAIQITRLAVRSSAVKSIMKNTRKLTLNLKILSFLNCRNYLLSDTYICIICLYTRTLTHIMFAVMLRAKCWLNESVTETSIPDYHTPRSAIISENTSLASSQQSEVDELLKCNRKSTPYGLVKQ